MSITEVFVTQQKAADILAEHFSERGREYGRNFQHTLNDQRRSRRRNPIPYVKLKSRVFYRVDDLINWANGVLEYDEKYHSGIYIVEGETELERLVKLSKEITKH